MITVSQLGRRSTLAVLAVIVTVVVMLGVLVTQTSWQEGDAALVNAAGRQRLYAERVLATALARRIAAGTEDTTSRRALTRASAEWKKAAARLAGDGGSAVSFSPGSAAARDFAALAALRDTIISAAGTATTSAADTRLLTAREREYVEGVERIIAGLEQASSRRLAHLVQLESACAILLLVTMALTIRLALQPAGDRLDRTVVALAESESRTRAMLDAMGEGMLLTDHDGRLLSWNPSALRILGIDAPFEDHDAVVQALREHPLLDRDGVALPAAMLPHHLVMTGGRAISDRLVGIRNRSGGVRWLSVNTHPLYSTESAEPRATVSIFRDVTEARMLEEERTAQAEASELQNQELMAQAEALDRERELFRSLVETAGTVIVGLDADGRVFEWNREAEALYGVARADALGRDYARDFVTDQYRERMLAGISQVLSGRSLRNLVAPLNGADGARRTVIWNITNLRPRDDGRPRGLIAAGLDITDREASDERFRVLFEHSSDAHLILDERGVIDCNDAALRLLRAESKEQVLGHTSAELSPRRQPDGRLSAVVGAQMRQQARDRRFHRFEWTHLSMDGREFPVQVTLTPVRLEGREVLLAVWHDIAEQKAVEKALRTAKDAAESANRTKSEFMTRMNHELRTPLTAIIGFSRILLQGKEGALSTGAQRYADRIRANGMHLLSLINQILDVAKVEAGRMEIDAEPVALDALVSETLAMLESTAEAKGIRLRRELPARLAPIVTDAAKLRQILINLVGNAIKFTDAGHVLVRVDTDPATDRPTAIVVQDTGIGVPLDRQQKIFEPFEQGESSTRRQFGGTGLGLAIVKTFAELIGATVVVESEPGQGTSFIIWLSPADLPLGEPGPNDQRARMT